MSPDQVARYQTKAAVAAAAWQQELGEAPTRHALVLAMAVADLETGLGNVKGHNWGFVHKRTLSSAESSILLGHGIYPTGNNALSTARGLLASTQASDEILTIDGGPSGPYFVWMWSFPSDAEAAAKFLDVLVRNRPAVRSILDTASPTTLAAAMYATHYFEGTSQDPRENIRAYASRIDSCAARIESALLGWPSGSAAPSPTGNPSAEGAAADAPRSSAGWWLAGFALLGLGAVILGRRP